jgi:hypothetical protein
LRQALHTPSASKTTFGRVSGVMQSRQ